MPDPGHQEPTGIDDEIAAGFAMEANVTKTVGASNGLPTDRFAANAASARSKLNDASRLLDQGDVAGARAAICAAMLELADDRR